MYAINKMGYICIILIIVYFMFSIRRTPPNSAAVLENSAGNKRIVQPNTYFLRGKDETYSYVDISPGSFQTVVVVRTSDNKNCNINIKFSYVVSDIIKVSEIEASNVQIVKNVAIKIVKKIYSEKTSKDILEKANKETIRVLDLLNENLREYGFSAKNLTLRSYPAGEGTGTENTKKDNSVVTRFDDFKFEQVDCIHIDENQNEEGNILSSLQNLQEEEFIQDVLNYGKDNAIKTFGDFGFAKDPIQDKQKFKNWSLSDLDDEDDDPIKNL